MTDILGTQKLSSEKQAEENQNAKPVVTNVVNVTQAKKSTKEKPRPEDKLWHNKVSVWILAGLAISSIPIFLSFTNKRFLALIPVAPTAGLFSWYVKRVMNRRKSTPEEV